MIELAKQVHMLYFELALRYPIEFQHMFTICVIPTFKRRHAVECTLNSSYVRTNVIIRSSPSLPSRAFKIPVTLCKRSAYFAWPVSCIRAHFVEATALRFHPYQSSVELPLAPVNFLTWPVWLWKHFHAVGL
ncbi:Uncharacterized protein APZ42_020128 [Daphnia magna]|uniref:Uncharacterized protein n=1 Tax=Daphnia magna TaxID=35525 RepID=A0A164Y0A3_9CRUS|nr:Uncharacterized protein APZ42_020128 [Daphnia magna]